MTPRFSRTRALALTPAIVLLAICCVVLAGLLLRLRAAYARECDRAETLNRELREFSQDASSELEASEQRFRDVVHVVPFGIFEADANGALVWASRRCQELLGADSDRMRALGWLQAVAAGDRELVEEQWLAGIENGRAFEIEFSTDEASAVAPVARFQVMPARAGNSRRGWIGTVADVSELRRGEEQRRALEERFERARKLESLGVLAGGIAHDFNNLLVSILGNSELLKQRATDDETRDAATRIETAALRAADLAQQMLAYSGRGARKRVPVDLLGVVQEMDGLLERPSDGQVRIHSELSLEERCVEGDPTQLRQVVMNLLVNAFEAFAEATPDVEVRLERVRADRAYLAATFLDDDLEPGEYVALDVIDRGCGMEEKTAQCVFDPFFTTKFTGRGLGLAVVLGIVRGHGGAIEVDSKVGEGTRFRVLLPVATEALGFDEAPVPRETRALRGGAILVIDDEPGVLDVAQAMLEGYGLRVLTAANGAKGLEVMAEHADEVALVLLDLTMPKMGGDEVYTRIRADHGDLPVVLLSGYSEDAARDRLGVSGLSGYIQKPFRGGELLDVVRAVVG